MSAKRPPDSMRREYGMAEEEDVYGVYGVYGDTYTTHPLLPEVRELPVDAMPRACRRLIREAAATIGCPPDFVALPMLVTLGSAIGTSRVLKLKRGWEEGATIYGVTIADPGEKKSPAAAVAIDPAKKAQAELKSTHKKKLEEYEAKMREHEKDKRECRRDGLTDPIPPEEPVMGRTLIDDTTVEALAVVLETNPRGVLLARDEIAAWARSMDQYKGGKGADRQFFLSTWSNQYASVDRKNRRDPLILQRPFVGMFGSIQPAILPELGDGREDGMLDRFLHAYPDPRPSRWTEDDISPEAEEDYRSLYGKLRRLYLEEDDHGDPEPTRIHLAPDAKAVLVEAINQHREEMERPGFPARLKGPWSKLEAYLARIALILALARSVDEEAPERVEINDVLAALALMDYFKTQARRVYVGLYGENPMDRLAADVTELLKKQGGSWRGTPTEFHEQLESEHKPKHPKDLTRYVKDIAGRYPALEFDDGHEAVEHEGKRTTQRYIELTVKQTA